MKFFIDTADIKEIKDAASLGILDGVTTNPSLVAKTGRNYVEVVREICELCPGPISAEVFATDHDTMLKEGRAWAKIAPNIVVKIPLIEDGLKVIKTLTEEGIKTNCTLCFSSVQALLAAKAGATFISPFLGRLDDISHDGMELIKEIRTIYDNFGLETEILSASIRSTLHVRDVALAGSDVATIPFPVFAKLIKHPLTDSGLKKFVEDSKNVPGSILDEKK